MKNTPYRVLVVDDELDMREELVALLEEHQFAVETANDGEEGLKKLLTEEFDIAMVDLKMPKMDGLTMIRRAKAENIDIPMVMLTGKGGPTDAFAASSIGVEEWFDKSSLDSEKLVERLSILTQNYRASDNYPALTQLAFKNLTLFPEATLEFSPQLNIFIGENGTGKTHLLKSAYSILAATAELRLKTEEKLTEMELATAVSDKLVRVFRAEQLSHLVRHQQAHCEMAIHFEDSSYDATFHFSSNSDKLQISHLPEKWLTTKPVFLPSHDLLIIFPNFITVYENYYLEFEETWRDTCIALGGLKQRKISHPMQTLLAELETSTGGKIELDKNGRFYLNVPERRRLEVPLIAEGQRKLAMLAQLMMTGALPRGYLFWDEPEANLNPRLIKTLAPILLALCVHGVQVFIATHSLFLLREIEICLASEPYQHLKSRWFGLHKQDQVVTIKPGDSVDDVGDIAALDEELVQSDRFMASGV
jgi:DNA-binding response OmpR family regulator